VVGDGGLGAVDQPLGGRREPLAFVGRGGDALGDRLKHVIEGGHTARLTDGM